MPRDPFAEVLDERTLRRMWRELARRHHPDANPGDPRAEERFKRLEGLRRRALARIQGRPWKRKTVTPPAPLRCVRCGDGFTCGSECPRCGIGLVDRNSDAVDPVDPRVEAMLSTLETPRPEPIFELAPEARLPLAAGLLFGLGLMQWRVGLLGLATLSVLFAFAAIGSLALERVRPAWARKLD